MIEETFADSIGEITLTGSVVRINFTVLSMTERSGNGRPLTVLRQRIVMPVEGFLAATSAMTDMVQRMVEAGVVTQHVSEPEAAALGAPDSNSGNKPTSPNSPNFP